LLHGRPFVVPDDVKALAGPVLAHRLILTAQARLRGETSAGIVARALDEIPAPVEDDATPQPAVVTGP
jgi:MoxR-like ATPase